jgi:protein SCO1/2
MGKGVKPLLFSLSLFFFFLYAGGWDPLEPGYRPSLPTVIKYGCLNITLPKAVLYNQYGEAVEFPPRGVYIVSFGYTYCPDVCPLTLAVLNATWRLSKLPIYVVSVDPERDTPDRLRAFAEGGRYPFMFLTGGEVERVWRAAGVYVARAKSGSGYVVYHDVLFLLVVDGTARGYVAGLPGSRLSAGAPPGLS